MERLWKARNELLFNNKRWAIPEIINLALMDFHLWKASQPVSSISHSHHGKPKAAALQEIMQQTSSFVCCADASWTDPYSKAGIGWVLYNPQGSRVLRGFSAIDPVNSVLEAEAITLKEALYHLRRLNYNDVTFCGDSITLYCQMEKAKKMSHPVPGYAEIQAQLDDIAAFSQSSYTFKFIRRSDNTVADLLAKTARCQNSPFTISWDY